MEKNEKSVFLPKGTDGRYKDIRDLHLQGLALVLVLLLALWASLSILIRSILSIVLDQIGGSVNPDDVIQTMEYSGLGGLASSGFSLFGTFTTVISVVSYIVAFASLAATIFLIIKMKEKISVIIDESAPYENPIRVKIGKLVWLGFLLGAYGGHLFALKKKKAWIFLLLGVLGMEIFPLFIYTSGISFADAFMACFIDKDAEGYITMEDYPYWI